MNDIINLWFLVEIIGKQADPFEIPQLFQIGKDLADTETTLCRKNKDAALESKRKGTQCFSNADYPNSLRFYSQALRDAKDMGKNLVSTLYVNRVAVLHKKGLLVECLRDCDRALLISPSYTKAWYRRGKANASLGNYEDAVLDLTVAMNVELSLGGKRQIESELKVYVGQNKEKSSSPRIASENSLDALDRGDVQKGSAKIFFRKVKFWKEDGEEEAPPVFVKCRGWGTNEGLIISILAHRNGAQRKVIRQRYAETYGEDLLEVLDKELSNDFENFLAAAAVTEVSAAAAVIEVAVK